MEKTIELEISSLLPGVEDNEDACIQRLEAALQNQRRMRRAHLEREGDGKLKLCLHYDADTISVVEVRRLAERAGVAIINRYKHEVLRIGGMDCSDCALVIEHSLGRMDGMLTARMNYPARKLWVEYDSHRLNHRAVEKRLNSLGYIIPLNNSRQWLQEQRELLLSLLSGVLLLVGWGGGQFFAFPALLSIAFFLAAYAAGGWDITRHALHALRERRFDTDTLMVMAALGAAALGHFAEGALLIFLFSLGHSLEERALEKARSAIEALADLAPKTALVRRQGQEYELPVEELLLSDVVFIRPGARIPVDGRIESGFSGVDQSPVTGESLPVDKTIGDSVYAGTINGEGALEVQVTRLAVDSTLARVMKRVEEAQAQKSPTQQVMERFERVFVPVVLGGTLLVIVVLPFFGVPLREAFLRAMTLLVAASPCALALGAPAPVLAGIAQAARRGVLVKGGAHLENLGRLKALALDKTGTITTGKPEVIQVSACLESSGAEDQVLGLAAALESRSGHPLAQAVVRSAQGRGISLPQVGDVESLTGRGLRSTFTGQPLWVGSLKLMTGVGVTVSPSILQQLETSEASGRTTILVALGTEVTGWITLADTLRPDIRGTLQKLGDLGIEKTILLTGDNPRAAGAIAREVGIGEFYPALMPEDKAEVVQGLVGKYGVVAMVGDGVNDAPALAAATVGIAMGGAGTDVALETADVALMSDNLAQLPFAVGLGRATRRIIVQNLVIALGVIALLVTASLAGWSGIGVAILFHEGSTILVVLNALRLLGYRG